MAELKPKTLARALEILAGGEEVTVVGGGTDLMVRNRAWAGLPARLPHPPLFTGGIAELRTIEARDDTLYVGGAVTLNELQQHPQTPECLKQALSGMAAPGIRNVGTMAGNICNASPAGDTLPVLYALDARVTLQSAQGMRELPVREFITGPGRNVLQKGELLTRIVLPLTPYNRMFYHKIGPRKAQAISKLTFIGLAHLEDGRITAFRAAFGAVGPTVVRRPEIEQTCIGKTPAELAAESQLIREAYAPYITPIDDQRSTAAYRKEAALGLLERFVGQIAEPVKADADRHQMGG